MYDMALMAANSTDCTKAKALADWLFWTQIDDASSDIAERSQIVLTSVLPTWKRMALKAVYDMQCGGRHVSSYATCISPDGILCSNGRGTCEANKGCTCLSGYLGQYCEREVSASSDSSNTDVILGATLGSVLPVLIILVLLILLTIIIAIAVARRRHDKDEWEIDTSEVEMGEVLGTGGYGQVYRARWRGTEVAVKMISAKGSLLTRDMQRNFADEVRTPIATYPDDRF